ncbi:nucleoid-associated protein [Stenotrophomonas sp.]|uniref:nucleoid-associated protein n=1 Tax=Stenotrophomonas sp. TaxID=69392 RepID=UPI0025FB99B6|nr:nucleoid-associated protein [Stenotrophomonas sp.]MBW8374456.1 nucleoid-associated protein [Stenotrophomonas sp.]
MDSLKFAVIHSLDKEAHSSAASVRTAASPLDVSIPQVVSLAEQLAKLVGRDGSSVFWGQFGSNNREGRFPGSVELLTSSLDAATFLTVSRVAMDELEAAASDESLSTGGYVCFVVYEAGGVNFLLVAMIKEKDAIRLDENMIPTEIREVDLSKLHQAARINLARYLEFIERGEEPDAEDETERTYLCFINRNSRQDVAKYFITALGCEKGVSSSRATKLAVDSIKKYVSSRAEIKQFATQVRRAVIDHLYALPDQSEVTIPGLVAVVRLALGENNADHIEDLGRYLNADAELPERFAVSAKFIKSVTRITAQAGGWKLSFDDTELSETDGALIYNRQDHSLRIARLPDDTIKRIEETLASRGQD